MTPAKKQPMRTTIKKASPKPKRQPPKPIEDLPTNPFTFEVFSVVSKQRSNAKKVEALQKFEHDSLKAIFIWNFDDSVISLLPPGEVPYSSLKDEQNTNGTLTTNINQQANTMRFNDTTNANQGHTTLRREWTKLYNFIKGGNDSLNGLRRETMFIQILEGLHPLDAEILCLTKDKKLQTKYRISRENVEQAYPDIEWGGRS
tara:strand:+ start:30 stop:635 length:606 start_codon:yes stop_codon:yes gene_type:complete